MARKESKTRSNLSRKTVSLEDGMRRRQETTLQIRKDKKGQRLAKRRQLNAEGVDVDVDPSMLEDEVCTVEDLPDLVLVLKDVDEGDKDELLKATRSIRKMLSIDDSAPVKDVIESGALPHLAALLMRVDSRDLQFEACWCLTNVASSAHTEYVVNTPNAVYNLTVLLCANDPNLREQAAWCLGNIAGHSIEYRDGVLSTGCLDNLTLNLRHPANDSLLANVTWAMSNLCRGKPPPPLEPMKPVCSLFAEIARTSMFDKIVLDALSGLSYFSDGDYESIEVIQQTGIVDFLVQNLRDGKQTFTTPILHILGNMITGTTEQTQVVLDAGILDEDILLKLLHSPKSQVRKETCWMLSNIAAGSPSQVKALTHKPRLINMLTQMAQSGEWNVRKEAVWAIANLFIQGTDNNVAMLIELDGIEAIVSVLNHESEPRTVLVALNALNQFLNVSKRRDLAYDMLFDDCDGISKLEKLQDHKNHKIYEKAVEILVEHFNAKEAKEDCDENLVPEAKGTVFSFGLPAKKLMYDVSGTDTGDTSMSSPLAASNTSNLA